MTTYIKSVIAAGLAVFLLSGCSSGTTATGLGLSIGGYWSGTMTGSDGFKANFTMQITQSGATSDDPFATGTLSGVLNTNKDCIGGGTFTGTLTGNAIEIIVTANTTLSMAGTAKTNYMSGSWVIDQVEETATVETTDSEGNVTSASSSSSSNACFATGGNWEASR